MKLIKNLILLCLFSTPLIAFADTISAASVPKDVRNLITRLRGCEHWTGEEPYDKTRAEEITKALQQFGCFRIDQDEALIRKKYRDNQTVIEAINKAKSLPF